MHGKGILIAAALLAASAEAAAADCLSKREARAQWPHSHLYWFNVSGSRCWSNSRGRWRARPTAPNTAVASKQGPPPTSAPPEAEQVFAPPVELRAVPPETTGAPQSIPVPPVSQVDITEPPPGPIYSTFTPGHEPEVWPHLEVRTHVSAEVWRLIIVLVGAFAPAVAATVLFVKSITGFREGLT